MRIVQLIDSLEAGGAERMAVSYANALVNKVAFSGIIVTRREGNLKKELHNDVSYKFLNKKRIVDLNALISFARYLKTNKVTHIQAHSTSVYFAFLTKLILPNIKIIWHDHYGKSEMLSSRKKTILRFVSLFLFGIITVNQKLKKWAQRFLFCKNVIYLANFTVETSHIDATTILKGISGKRIICLANLRPQKDHFLLLEIALQCKENYQDWTFHLVGKDFNDEYSRQIKNKIIENNLHNNVFLYDSCGDVSSILKQCEIGILTSNSEGLPVSILEYGYHNLAVLSTAVGEISTVINHNKNGLLVHRSDDRVLEFTKYLSLLIENINFRKKMGYSLNETVLDFYTEDAVMKTYFNWINEK